MNSLESGSNVQSGLEMIMEKSPDTIVLVDRNLTLVKVISAKDDGNYIRLCTISKIIKGHMIMYPFIIQSFFSFFFPFPSFLTLQERVFRKRGSRGSVFGL